MGVLVARGNGIPARFTHGWILDTDAGHALAQVYIKKLGQWFDVAWQNYRDGRTNPFGDDFGDLRFDINKGHVLTAGSRYSESVGSGGGWRVYDQASKLRITMNAIGNFDAKQSFLRDLTPQSPGWISFDAAAK